MRHKFHSSRSNTKNRSGSKPSRESGGAYWMYGLHACAAALENPERSFRRICLAKAGEGKIGHLLGEKKRLLEQVEPSQLDMMLGPDVPHQGIAMLVNPLEPPALDDVLHEREAEETMAPVVLLDHITDPHNVGAILRSAAAFGIAAVITTRAHAPKESGAMAKAASGALETVPLVQVGNLVQGMEVLKQHGYWCIGFDSDTDNTLEDLDFGVKTAIVLGAEGEGMRRLTWEQCDAVIRIPMTDNMESLNVSNAAAIALYSISRKAGLIG
jgi:23S rRNA (guanosine2251-2'-O)-methyltransferase